MKFEVTKKFSASNCYQLCCFSNQNKMILSGKAEKAFPRGGVVKKKKSESSEGTTGAKKLKENDDLFATKIEAAKKTVKSDAEKAKKKGKKRDKKETEEDDILAVKQVKQDFVLTKGSAALKSKDV